MKPCGATYPRRWGYATCDRTDVHDAHTQSSTGITWTDAEAEAAWADDSL